MQIKELMTKDVDWIGPDTALSDAAKRMRDDDIGALPVGENDKLIGMLTDRDIVVRVLSEDKDFRDARVRDAMSDKLLYCYDDQEIESVAANMGDQQVRRMPVIDRDGKRLVGMISLGDIAKHASSPVAGDALSAVAEDRI
jgi:CBS domain-containing protein